MNNIKPHWIAIGALIVSTLWLTEMNNRPDTMPEYSEFQQQRHSKVSSQTSGKVSNSRLDSDEKQVSSNQSADNASYRRPPANALSAYTSADANVVVAQEQIFSQQLTSPDRDKKAGQSAIQTQLTLSEY